MPWPFFSWFKERRWPFFPYVSGFNDEITNQLDILISKDSRIILGNFNETWARAIFCDAYKKGVYGRKFQWIIVGMYEEEWWQKDLSDTGCTAAEMATALVGVMVMDIQALASREEITVSGRVSAHHFYGILVQYIKYHLYLPGHFLTIFEAIF